VIVEYENRKNWIHQNLPNPPYESHVDATL
jgi:hypothetical protein